MRQSDPGWLFGKEAMSFHGGVYIFAWRYDGKYFPHYVGQTSTFLVERIVIHMNGYLSAKYWLYNPAALDDACRDGVRPASEVFYVSGHRQVERHAEALRRGALSDYFSGLSFFMAEVQPDLRRPVEKALTILAYEASAIMDSPKNNGAKAADASATFPTGVEVVGLA